MKKLIIVVLVCLINLSVDGQTEGATLKEGIYANMETTKGTIILRLHYKEVPLTVANFVALSEGDMPNKALPAGTPFYDGNKFHRVISNFMIQGGDPRSCPLNKEKRALGYRFRDEFQDTLKHVGPGILSMANAGPGTNASQFFITHGSTPWLNNKHSVFGKVVFGQDVVNAIEQGDKIIKVTIIRKGKDAEAFDALETFNTLKKG